MSHYSAEVLWRREGAAFVDQRYSRRHLLRFDGGLEVPGSASPQVVRVPLSDPSALDPEEAFVASLAACHMLWFLSLAAEQGFVVDEYRDEARGVMAKNEQGRQAMTEVTLFPQVRFASAPPSAEQHEALHHRAHECCFIASSVKTTLRCEPRIV